MVGRWVASQSGGAYADGAGQCIGLLREDTIIAGCIFENFNGVSMVAHLAIRGRITREFLFVLADYAFRQHRIHKLIAPINSTNTKMRKLAFHMGFVRETTIVDAAPDGDIDLFTMLKEECPFLGDEYRGKAKTA